MPDNLSAELRHRAMSRIGSKNTAPEMLVRSLLHGMGLSLPSAPKRSAWIAGYCAAEVSNRDFCSRLLLASAPRLQKGDDSGGKR